MWKPCLQGACLSVRPGLDYCQSWWETDHQFVPLLSTMFLLFSVHDASLQYIHICQYSKMSKNYEIISKSILLHIAQFTLSPSFFVAFRNTNRFHQSALLHFNTLSLLFYPFFSSPVCVKHSGSPLKSQPRKKETGESNLPFS